MAAAFDAYPASTSSSAMAESAGGPSSSPRNNPLVDLIETEKTYVEQLGLVIRKVAGAWSRANFPPAQLDAMFRCVEAVYRANRTFGTKLKDIGPNPSSPKALGDLLMRWIDDLEAPYYRYCTTFMTGFDTFQLVLQNDLLPPILAANSQQISPPPPLNQWTLDALFLLPYTRLRYYKKLYARLLRSTKEGRSDHRLLLVANERLEKLIEGVEGRLEVDVTDVVEGRGDKALPHRPDDRLDERVSRTSSAMDSSLESHSGFSPFNSRVDDGSRSSGGSANTALTQTSPARRPSIAPSPEEKVPTPTTALAPLSDLELRLDPERTLDLFTMTHKKCKLQMNPPTLPFTRALRSSHDVTLSFTPTCTGQQIIHRRAHVFILSDLFLVAERMEASEKAAKAAQLLVEDPARVGEGGPMPEMWLCYPPLAGKHLMVAEGNTANVLNVMVMKKETFEIHAESDLARESILRDLIDCIDFAAAVAPKRAQPSPTVPQAGSVRSPTSMSDGPAYRHPTASTTSSPASSPHPERAISPPAPGLTSQMGRMNVQEGELRWPSPALASLPPRGASLGVARQPSHPSMRPPPPPKPGNSSYQPSPPQSLNSYGPHPSFEPMHGPPLPRSASGRSTGSQPSQRGPTPELPPIPGRLYPGQHAAAHYSDGVNSHAYSSQPEIPRSRSAEPLRPIVTTGPAFNTGSGMIAPPSARFNDDSFPGSARASPVQDEADDSPPASPVEEDVAALSGPAVISAQMKCKVFLQQQHQQWKSLGAARLKLYVSTSSDGRAPVKQLVVEADSSSKTMLISTIVLTDGVERVARTGVAVEISDRGKRTGIIYMIQLRNEKSAVGLFESLLAGSDRDPASTRV